MSITERRLAQAGELRALAHPVRLQLMQELFIVGEATASELAVCLGETQANCSWHLRQLARFGLVEQVPDPRSSRRKPYRPTADRLRWSPSGDDGATAEAASELSAQLLDEQLAVLRSWLARQQSEPAPWRDAASVIHGTLWLTSDELASLTAEIERLASRHVERLRDPDARPDGSQPVRMVAWAVPARRIL